MPTLQDTFNDFFSKTVDVATGQAECLYCFKTSAEGGGRWSGYLSTWVCSDHVERQDSDEQAEQQKKRNGILRKYGESGRGYVVYSHEPTLTVEVDGETFAIARKFWVEADHHPEEGHEAGWYIKIK